MDIVMSKSLLILLMVMVANSNNNITRFSGTTTRFWDCCKPTCGWIFTTPKFTPVSTCSSDGVSILDANQRSGCQGGPYACNNQQPWSVNDKLSYAFAAAELIAGQKKEKLCCQCYELKFTSGPVKGKTLIVQITNTGTDVNENQFDLQIPGGGMGIFNGCESQWNITAREWGRTYGGLRFQEECNHLPSQLRSGCKWRFNWFRNSDNPSVDFFKVSCPAELTDKSNCSRNL